MGAKLKYYHFLAAETTQEVQASSVQPATTHLLHSYIHTYMYAPYTYIYTLEK